MPPTHLLLPMHRWSSREEGSLFPVGGRSRWDITLNVGAVSVGGSITVIIEKSPAADDLYWVPLVTFPAQTTSGVVTKSTNPVGTPAPPADFTVNPLPDRYLRARILAISGEVVGEVRAVAPFFDINDSTHLALVSQELRSWKDGRDRTIRLAEEQVLDLITSEIATGTLDFDLTTPSGGEEIREAIAAQADHLRRRAELERSMDPASLVSLREMSFLLPGLAARLGRFRPLSTRIWYGR